MMSSLRGFRVPVSAGSRRAVKPNRVACLTSNASPRWMTVSRNRSARKDRGIVVAMPTPNTARDIRLLGFADRAPLSTAWAWLDAWPVPSSPEIVPLAEAIGRILAEAITAGIDAPGRPHAAENGYAVRSPDCDGASAYNPLLLSLPSSAQKWTRKVVDCSDLDWFPPDRA